MRPTGLAAATLTMCALNLTGFLFIGGSNVPTALALPLLGFIILLSYIVLWFFWQGRNWARWLVLLTSGLAMLNLALLTTVPPIQKAIIITEAVVGAFLLYWLNTAAVRAFFIRKNVDGVA